jgi:4-amino-4-deoxy-L-arabinose transferase-like glycosyltransferase
VTSGRENARDAAILVALVVLGALLRLPLLFAGLWRDESSTYFEIAQRGVGDVLVAVAHGELNPPGFFLLERAWTAVAGTSDVALKFPSFAFGLALIVATYALGRVAAGRGVSLLAATFACLAPVAIDISGEARPYALAALLAACVVGAFLRVVQSRNVVSACAWFAALGTALVYVHYTGILLLALLAVAAPYVCWRAGRPALILPLAASYAAMGLLVVPWLRIMLEHFATSAPWTDAAPKGGMLDLAVGDFGFLLPILTRHSLLGQIAAAGIVVTAAVVAFRLVAGKRVAPPSGSMFTLGLCAIGAPLAAAWIGMREPRYMVVFAPAAWVWFSALCFALAHVIAGVRGVRPRLAFSALAVCLALLIVGGEVGARRRQPDLIVASGIHDLAPAARALDARERTLFLVAPDYLGPTFGFYVGTSPRVAEDGFARWDHPEQFSPRRYVELWDAPDLLPATEERIRKASRDGYARLVMIRDADIRDRGRMRFTLVDSLMAWLRATYPLLSTERYAGRRESVVADVFALR